MKRLFPLIAALLYLLSQTVLAEVGNDGLHKQPWFHQSFLELADDVHEAADEGKFLVVLIEQSGCPYCRELHEVNFKRSEVTDYPSEHALFCNWTCGAHEKWLGLTAKRWKSVIGSKVRAFILHQQH